MATHEQEDDVSVKVSKKSPLENDARAIFKAALEAVDPEKAVSNTVHKTGDVLTIVQASKTIESIDLKSVNRIFLVGAGKATAPMAKALEKVLGARLAEGIISVKKGHGLELKRTTVLEAAHPVPDAKGVSAAKKIKALLDSTTDNDLVFSLISGGGSALAPLPADGLKLGEKQAVTKMMLECGASIHEINAVRKHLSRVKGGQLARAAAPARVVNLMLSDVVGDDMDTIASGPFVPDPSTFDDAMLILSKYKLLKTVPPAVVAHLKKGLTREVEETPKPGELFFKNVTNLVIGSNYISLLAAETEAKQRGYKTLILSSTIEGETREIARMHAAIAREVCSSGHPIKAPACIISGGETTVTIKGKGKGGRNQEFVLAAALDIDKLEDVLVFSAGTDGTDGPTDAAGAFADGTTCRRAQEANLSPHKHLDENNAYPFFEKLGGLIITGPTRTNVMDVRLVLVA